jgi:hypothetical protein
MKKKIFFPILFLLIPVISLSACSMIESTDLPVEAPLPVQNQAIPPSPTDTEVSVSTASPEGHSESVRADLPDLGDAPELTNQVWLNVENPLRLSDLRGRVVLLEMWTFG